MKSARCELTGSFIATGGRKCTGRSPHWTAQRDKSMKAPDLVLKNGSIIDGSGRMRYSADLAILGGRILAIDGQGTLSAGEEIDCSGLIIAPGFIDTHS